MKAVAALFALLVPLAAQAQDTTAVAAGQDTAAWAVPPGLSEVETARSRSCVAALARIDELEAVLRPYAVRMERLNALGRAVSLEDRSEAGPLDATDSTEAVVGRWFVADSILAQRYITEKVESIQIERAEGRTAILDRIRGEVQAVSDSAQAHIGDPAALEASAEPCDGAIFVRSAVLDACAGIDSRLCRAASDTSSQSGLRFVDAAADLWDVEDYRPWSAPEPLQFTAQGGLAGARVTAQGRRGNVVVAVALAPLLPARQELDSAGIAQLESHLDSLGYIFDHPLFAMSPVIELQANVPAPIGGETHLLLHFGDLSGDDVIWSGEVGTGGIKQASILASGADLERLRSGELVSLTAVRVPEGEDPTAEAVYTVPILQVGQTQYVTALLQYMGGGALSRDLMTLIPPPAPGAEDAGR